MILDLRKTQAVKRAAFTRYEATRNTRNALVRHHAARMTHAQIAAATGLTRSRIGQLAAGVRKLPNCAPEPGAIEALRKAQTATRAAFARNETAREASNAAVRQAAGEKVTHAQIAAATSVSRSRAGKLARP